MAKKTTAAATTAAATEAPATTATAATTAATATATATTVAPASKPLFSRIKESKIEKFTNEVKDVQMNSLNKGVKHAVANYYLAIHSIAFTSKAKSKKLKDLEVTLESLTSQLERLETTHETLSKKSDLLLSSQEIEKTKGFISSAAEDMETVKIETSVIMTQEKEIIDHAISFVPTTLYSAYKGTYKEFRDALVSTLTSYNLTCNDSLIDYFTYKLSGIRKAGTRDVSTKGNAISYRNQREFNNLFIAVLCQLCKEKNVVNFVKFEETLSKKAEMAIFESRQIMMAREEKRMQAEKDRKQQEEQLHLA